MIYKSALIVLFLCYSRATEEGEPCSKGGSAGICRNLKSCQPAIDGVRRRIHPQICGFDGQDPIVCCVDDVSTTIAKPVAITTSGGQNYLDQGASGCEPIPPNHTSQKTGQKAWDKCIEYQERLMFPCTKTLTGELVRKNKCRNQVDQLIEGDTEADRYEFRHFALLGYGDIPKLQWLCGGTLISDRFILTAGHCISARETGAVKYVLLGTLLPSEKYDSNKLYKVSRIVKHPEYKPPVRYNDIALLETEKPINLDQFLVPACLDVGDTKDESNNRAFGLNDGRFGHNDDNTLRKITLAKVTNADCSKKIPATRLIKSGINETTQLCYVENNSKDNCPGYGGSPLQVKSYKIYCMYNVIGVTSFGRPCGYGDPTVFTRVSAYVGWIESVVWP